MERKKQRIRIDELFVQAEVTANRVVYGFNDKRSESDLIKPWDVYPELYDGYAEAEEERQTQMETEMLKAQMDARVALWNARFRKEHEDGSRETESRVIRTDSEGAEGSEELQSAAIGNNNGNQED